MIEGLLDILVNLFIGLMLFWMLFWDSEPNNPIKKHWIPFIKPAFLYLGLTAEWKMFSPDPFLYNSWPYLKIYLDNGEFLAWEPKKGNELTAIEKIKYKKSHKFYHEVGRAKASFHVKIDFIEYLLAKHDLHQRCIRVEVYRVHQNIRPYNDLSGEESGIFKNLVYTYQPLKTQ